MDTASQNRLAKVHPVLRERVANTLAVLEARGLDVRVVQGLRTEAEQNRLYAQGRTAPGQIVTNARAWQSNHNYGLAVDVTPFVNGKPDWNNNSAFVTIGYEAHKHQLVWGGDWRRFIDKPHLELPTGLTVTQCKVLYNKGGLQAVWAKASELLGSTVVASPSESKPSIKVGPVDGQTRPLGIPQAQPSILKRGSKGNAVYQVQLKLHTLGYTIKADSDYGLNTETVIRMFQREHGLKADGVVGPDTLAKLALEPIKEKA